MKNNLGSLYFILGCCAAALILTGIFLPWGLSLISVKLSQKILLLLQIAFIVSGFLDILLIFYAKKQLK